MKWKPRGKNGTGWAGEILAETAFNSSHLSHYAVGLSASDSSSGHRRAGQRIPIVAKKEQEDRTILILLVN